MLFAGVHVCTFQLGSFTGWCSERVKGRSVCIYTGNLHRPASISGSAPETVTASSRLLRVTAHPESPFKRFGTPHYTATRVLCIKRLYTRIALRGSGWRFVADGFQTFTVPVSHLRGKGWICGGWFWFSLLPYRFYEERGGFVADGFVSFSVPVSLLRGNSLVCGLVAIASLLRRYTFYRLLEGLSVVCGHFHSAEHYVYIYTPACYGRG